MVLLWDNFLKSSKNYSILCLSRGRDKRLKKNLLWLVACLLVGLLTGCGPSESSKREETARQLVEDIVNENYSALRENYKYDDKMDTLINGDQLEEILQSSLQGYGEVVQISDDIAQSGNTYVVSIQMEKGYIDASVTFQGDSQICGLYLSPNLAQAYPLPNDISEQEISFKATEKITLSGTLCVPKGQTTYPLVIFVHGSGPCDRDETIGANQVFRDLAIQLAKKGIASYRYDKRTYVQQEVDKDFTIEDETVDDVLSAIQCLKENDEVNCEQIYVLGHSLGGQLIPMIAQQTNDVQGWIMMAPPARTIQELLLEQTQFLAELDGTIDESEEAQIAIMEDSVQKIEHYEAMDDEQTIFGVYKAYWASLANYDQVEEAKQIMQPVLLLQGEEDYQVTMTDFSIWQKQFQDNPLWTLKSYPNLTHLMMPGKKANGSADYNYPQTISEEVVETISQFINDHQN